MEDETDARESDARESDARESDAQKRETPEAAEPVAGGPEATAPEIAAPEAAARDATTNPPEGSSRDELLAAHRAARARRAAAPLGSEAYREAAEEVGRIEVEIARRERAAHPARM